MRDERENERKRSECTYIHIDNKHYKLWTIDMRTKHKHGQWTHRIDINLCFMTSVCIYVVCSVCGGVFLNHRLSFIFHAFNVMICVRVNLCVRQKSIVYKYTCMNGWIKEQRKYGTTLPYHICKQTGEINYTRNRGKRKKRLY